MYGTTLVKKDQEAVPRWRARQQEEKVSERFHGAFTGGFSAGYFNSVGSKEGWAPSQFKSTRAQKAQRTEQNAQDFMDQEDLEDIEKSVILLPLQEDPPEAEELDLLTRLLKPLIRVSGIYKMGYKIMERMGWNQGQGVGPKITKKMAVNDFETRQFEIAPLESESAETSDDKAQTNSRACKGLGYNMALPRADSPEPLGGPSRSISEVMANPSKTRKRKLPLLADYDDIEEDEDVLIIRKKALPKVTSKPKFISNSRITNSLHRCSDGSVPTEGFLVSIRPLFVPKEHKMIKVPQDFNPLKQYTKTKNESDIKLTTSTERAELLDEPQLKTTVSDYLPDSKIKTHNDDKDRKPSVETYSTIPRSLALAALSHTSSPYPLDRAKNARYRLYLESQAGVERDQKLAQSVSELMEFQRVAMIFRPVGGAIADRFTSATGKTDETIVRGASLSIAEEAAQQGNYGQLTFSVVNWTPERLLSKRFGVSYVGVEPAEEDIGSAASTFVPQPTARPDQSSVTKRSSVLKPEEVPTKTVSAPTKAPKDLFDAVFGDDEDDEDEDEDDI